MGAVSLLLQKNLQSDPTDDFPSPRRQRTKRQRAISKLDSSKSLASLSPPNSERSYEQLANAIEASTTQVDVPSGPAPGHPQGATK